MKRLILILLAACIGGLCLPALCQAQLVPSNVARLAAPPASGFAFGHAGQQAASTSSGDQSFTITWSDAGSHTPDCALLAMTLATTDATAVNGTAFALGAMSSTSARWATGIGSEHNVSTSNAYRYSADVSVVSLFDGSGAIDGLADAATTPFSSNTVTINWSNPPTSAVDVSVIAFAGTDACVAGTVNPSDADAGTVDVTTLGETADLVIFTQTGATNQFAETVSTHFHMPISFYDGTRNRMMYKGERDARSTTNTQVVWRDDAVGCDVLHSPAACNTNYSISSHASGFTVTSNGAGSNANELAYLAVALPSGKSAYAGTIVTPTGVAPQTVSTTDPGFEPQGVLLVGALIDNASGSAETASPASEGWFFGHAISTTSEYNLSIEVQDGDATSDTQSRSDDGVATLTTDGNTVTIECDVQSLDATGFTLNCTTTNGTARNWIYLAIE